MSEQRLLFELPARPADPSPAWTKEGGEPGGGKFARYHYRDTGWCVEHCGHPTANFPYVGFAPDGRMILPGGIINLPHTGRAPSYAFQYLADAQRVVAELADAEADPHLGTN